MPTPDSGMEDEPFNIDELFLPVRSRRLSRLPRLVNGSVRLCYRAARREFVGSVILQLLAGVALAAQLLLGRRVLDAVLSPRATGGFVGVLPELVALAVVSALVSFASMARSEQERLITELTSRHAVGQVLEVAGAVDLLAYERPSFHNRLQRALVNAEIRPSQMAGGVVGILSSLFAIGGIGVALLLLQPIFLLLVVAAYVPAWLASLQASRVAHDFSLEQTERDRARQYIRQVLSGKDEAKEVRAFNLGDFLRDRHDRLLESRIADLRSMVRRRLRFGLVGGLATSFLTAAAVGVLIWMATNGRIDPAGATAAAGAVVLLGQRLRGLASSAGSLYESSLFLEDFTTFVEIMPVIAARRPTRPAPAAFSVLSVVLDEPTAALDPRAERDLFDRIRELARGRSVLLISHRFSSVRSADRIYVLSDGEIVEEGTHAALMERRGSYAEMFTLQASAYGYSEV